LAAVREVQACARPAQVFLELWKFVPAEELIVEVAVDLLGVVVKAAGQVQLVK
jgi:N12 class adenine-specific DNA methylase